MKYWLGLLVLVAPIALLSACEQQPAGEPVVRTELGENGADESSPEIVEAPAADTSEEPQSASACGPVSFEGNALTHCIADPARHTIRTVTGPDGGQPFGSLSAFAKTVEAKEVAFAMNGGAFGDDLRALGYYVEDGARLSELDRGDGKSNFYMKPNGVFFGSSGEWRVLATENFFSNVRDRPQFGTQSGPMLVIDGEMHPDFSDDGASRAIRHGVGIDTEGRAHFVISDEPISFGKIARYFRDDLETRNALLLISNNSALWDPVTGRLDEGRSGPIIVVENRE